MYTTLINFAVLFALGFGSGYKIQSSRIGHLESEMAAANAEASHTLEKVTSQLESARVNNENANKELDKSHEASINTINAYHAKFSDRVSDSKKGCGGTVPKGGTAVSHHGDAADNAKLSKDFIGLLESESRRADQCAVDKGTLLDFVRGGCGIAN